jgi:hypothetical protein
MEINPNNWERSKDPVYTNTTDVVRAVLKLSSSAGLSNTSNSTTELVEAVKEVGTRLRELCATVDVLADIFPPHARKEIEMAHQVLSKDMSGLVDAMRLTIQYSSTTLHLEYTK